MYFKPPGVKRRSEIEDLYDQVEQLQIQIDNLKAITDKLCREKATAIRSHTENFEQEVK